MDAEKAWNSQRILSEDAEEPSNSMARRGPKLTPWSRVAREGRERKGENIASMSCQPKGIHFQLWPP